MTERLSKKRDFPLYRVPVISPARAHAATKVAALAPDEIAPSVHAVTSPVTVVHDRTARSRPGMVLDIRPARAATAGPDRLG